MFGSYKNVSAGLGESLQYDGKQRMGIIPLCQRQCEESLDAEQQLESRYILTAASTIVENLKEVDGTKQQYKIVLS